MNSRHYTTIHILLCTALYFMKFTNLFIILFSIIIFEHRYKLFFIDDLVFDL